jgi:hypothetical protein
LVASSVKTKVLLLKGVEHIMAAVSNHDGNQSLQDAGRAVLEKLPKFDYKREKNHKLLKGLTKIN